MPQLYTLVLIGSGLCLLLMLLLLPVLLRVSPAEQRLNALVSQSTREGAGRLSRARAKTGLLTLAKAVRSTLGLDISAKAKRRLELAGYRTPQAAETYFLVSWFVPLIGIFAGSFFPDNTMLMVLVLGSVGYLIPDFTLARLAAARQKRLQRSLPDAMDLLVICTEAGLGLDQALLRVSTELELSSPDLHEELTRLQSEQRAGTPRAEAWERFRRRTVLQEVDTFVSMLVQADRFGTPLAKGLGRFADELRTRRKQRAEEAAAKTKVKIIFPLVCFIFPALFVVLLAPALISVIAELKGLAR